MITIAFWSVNIQLQRSLLYGCYRCRNPKILTDLCHFILLPSTFSKHISYIPMCLLNEQCLAKFTSLNMWPNVQAICIFVVVIREKLEIIFHQTLAPNVENKDTDHFHKKKPKHSNTCYFILRTELFSEI